MTTRSVDVAMRYSEALDRCTSTDGDTIDEVMALVAEDAVRSVNGRVTERGKAALQDHFLRRARHLEQTVEIHGLDVWGDLIVCRISRRDSTMTRAGVEHHLRVLTMQDGLITSIAVITSPTEDAGLRQ